MESVTRRMQAKRIVENVRQPKPHKTWKTVKNDVRKNVIFTDQDRVKWGHCCRKLVDSD